jgi:hypothetical protein
MGAPGPSGTGPLDPAHQDRDASPDTALRCGPRGT